MKTREEMLAEFNEQKERMRRERSLSSRLESILKTNQRTSLLLIIAACFALISSVCSVIATVKALLLALL